LTVEGRPYMSPVNVDSATSNNLSSIELMRFTYRVAFVYNTSVKAYYEHAHILAGIKWSLSY